MIAPGLFLPLSLIFLFFFHLASGRCWEISKASQPDNEVSSAFVFEGTYCLRPLRKNCIPPPPVFGCLKLGPLSHCPVWSLKLGPLAHCPVEDH